MSVLATLLVLLALLCSLHLCGAAVYYVKPTQPQNATCPSDNLCLTLDDYAVNSERYFTSNAVFLFLSGQHEINSSFNVGGIHGLILKPFSERGSVVVQPLNYPVTVWFMGVSNIAVAELTLNSIRLAFINSSDITLTGLVISVDWSVLYSPSNQAARPDISPTGCDFFELRNTGILSTNSEIVFTNRSLLDGTTIASYGNSSIVLWDDAKFIGTKSQQLDCGIVLYDHSVFISKGNVTFSKWRRGAIVGKGDSTLILNGTVVFTDNNNDYIAPDGAPSTYYGGTITLKESSTSVIAGDIDFNNNFAYKGGAIALNDNCHLVLNGTVTFTANHGYYVGGTILVSGGSTLVLDGDITFINNYLDYSVGNGGAIASIEDSSVVLQGHVTFLGNNASSGGAIALMGNRTIWFPEPDDTLITFANNLAVDNGGALYFSAPSYFFVPLQCAFFFEHLPIDPVLNFTGNTAGQGGDAIYNAYFESGCNTPSGTFYDYFPSVIRNISLFSPSFSDDTSLISSDPTHLCFCKEGRLDCDGYLTSSVYPGELFHAYAVVVGDMRGLVNSTVLASISISKYANLGDLQSSQTAYSRNCTRLTYSIYVDVPTNYEAVLTLSSGRAFNDMYVSVLECPVGFVLSSKKFCECPQPILNLGTVSCNISEKSIERQGTAWIGVLLQNTNHTSVIFNNTSVIFSNTCPFTHCSRDKINIPVNQTYLDQDVQCNDHRSGVLCGGCRPNHSLALGSNRCLPDCTNNSLSLLIAFAAAGIALVFFIKILNLTVSQGTLNGLIFYANIIGAAPTLVFPTRGNPASRAVSTFLSVFIAWLNLDLGIETCFFDGMDTYVKVWLQFTFPIYIWFISLFIIISSSYSTSASRLFGNDSVPVLATLIMLSYAKLLRAVISPLSVSSVEFLNGTTFSVWEFDGNLKYLSGKHIPLFVLALLVLGFLMLFTFVIITIQWLNRATHYRVLCWVTKLKPFFDAFTGPFKDKHHYWVGILLLVRCVILLIIFLYTSSGKGTALLCIVFAALITLTVAGSKYRNKSLAILEQSYILNLGLLAAGTVFVQYVSIDGNQEVLYITSVGIAFLQFVATVIFHAFVRLRKPLNKIKAMRMRTVLKVDSESQCETSRECQPIVQPRHHNHSVQFRESLLAYVDEN